MNHDYAHCADLRYGTREQNRLHGVRFPNRGKEKSMVHLGPCYRKNLCVDCDSEICGHAGVPEADCPLLVCKRPELECKDCDILKEYVDAYRKGGPDEH